MACEVSWTEHAHDDLNKIIRYIAVHLANPQAASEHLDAFEEAIRTLSMFPCECAIRDHPALHSRGLRVKPVKRYIILYSYADECVTIHRIFHSLQDYARIIDEM